MPIIKKILQCLMLFVFFFCLMSTTTFAASTMQDGLQVSFITDKETYDSNESIVAILSVTNTNDFAVTDLFLENRVPVGYKIASESETTLATANIASGETLTLTVTYVADSTTIENETKDNNNSNSETKTEDNLENNNNLNTKTENNSENNNNLNTKTGDNLDNTNKLEAKREEGDLDTVNGILPYAGDNVNYGLGVVLISGILGVNIILNVNRKKNAKKILSLFLIVSLVFPIGMKTFATMDTINGTTSSKIIVVHDIMIESQKRTLEGVVTYHIMNETEETERVDTDNDGVPDYLEEYFGTSSFSNDTDGDGLSDYTEIYLTNTDPTLIDSDEDGVKDADEDLDEDGLSNREEIKRGTNPAKKDSDSDGLTDGQEVELYLTDPTKYDTDEDGLSDGEEMALGLDPLNPISDGLTPDKERLLEQTLNSENIETSLLEDNVVIPSISGKVSGNINHHIKITEADIYALADNRAIVGKQVHIQSDYENKSELILKFTGLEEERFAYYMICQYREGEIVPCETVLQGNTISASVRSGYYFVIDAEKLLIDLNVPIEKYKTVNYGMKKVSSEASGQADIVFVIDTTKSMYGAIRNVVANIDKFVDTLQSEYSVKANFALIDYKDITYGETTTLVKNGTLNWFSDVDSFKQQIDQISVEGGGDLPEAAVDGLALASELDFRQNANKFVIILTDAAYKVNNDYGIESMEQMIQILADKDIVTSVISRPFYEPTYHDLYTQTNGIFANIYDDFCPVLLQMADKIGEVVNDGSWVLLSDYQHIKLDQPLGDDGYSSDDDILSDQEELGEPIEKDIRPYINWVLKKYNIPEGMYDDIESVKVYQYKSNPLLSDTDFDGRRDDEDTQPRNNDFHGELQTDYANSRVSFDMDYRWFFQDNMIYNNHLSVVSLLFSSAVYGNSLKVRDCLNKDVSGSDLEEVMKYFGFKNPKKISVTAEDHHLSEVGLGYRTVEYKGETQTILVAVIRGTNGSIEEWTSNFELGDLTSYTGEDDWKNSENHKGFDITANRIMVLINQYITENALEETNLAYWMTGHSRGAAIANIVGANLEEAGKRSYTYTFATPNTTLSRKANDYKTIFNVVNSDDFVPCLPMNGWGYTRYGKTTSASIASNYEHAWEELTNIGDYNPDTFGMQTTVSKVTEILSLNSEPRTECYKYTCNDHGDASDNSILVEYSGSSKYLRDKSMEKIPNNARPYCKIEPYDRLLLLTWGYTNCQTPAYFLQILAAKMAGNISNYQFVVGLDMASRYSSAKTAIIRSAIGGLEHPHYTESYYILAKNMKGNQFK